MNIHIIPEKTPADKEYNCKKIEIAGEIDRNKIIELIREKHGLSKADGKRQNMLLIDYIRYVAGRKTPNTRHGYDALLLFMRNFAPDKTFKDIDKKFCLEFITT